MNELAEFNYNLKLREGEDRQRYITRRVSQDVYV